MTDWKTPRADQTIGIWGGERRLLPNNGCRQTYRLVCTEGSGWLRRMSQAYREAIYPGEEVFFSGVATLSVKTKEPLMN